ncbi:AraC family transcriptional regulator [Maribacter litoralis]|uniref:HTH araC/xylS-type domain-containing protein n=1 Tax=Maribacter litoralis TaxID=2059726 RepID=A0A653WV49_9FLAO|nr:AraC family transcriptional regulator [Maribacter litoralis]MBP92645.1 hypothetical protein [Flavobacteriaceae bacterium]VXC22123.1 conserved hypothetical protein [Maribacter litoralis]
MIKKEFEKLLKKYDKKIVIDKIIDGRYQTLNNDGTSLHRHIFYQIVWIENGSGVHIIENKKYDYTSGTIFLLAPYYLHKITYNKDVQGYVVSFCDSLLDRFQNRSTLLFHNIDKAYIKVSANEISLLNDEFNLLNHYSKTNTSTSPSIIQNYLHIILTKINAFNNIKEKSTVQSHTNNTKLLEQFVQLVRVHYTNEKQLSFYTSTLAISQKKLNLAIRNITGLTPAKFLEIYILNEASRILRYSNLSIKEIVAELGYSDSSYFIKAFKKQFKKTPIEYRKSAELNLNTK